MEIPEQNIQPDSNPEPKKKLFLIPIIVVISILLTSGLFFYLIYYKKIDNQPANLLPNRDRIINQETATFALQNGLEVTLPIKLDVFSGWKNKLAISFKNPTGQEQVVTIKFNGLPFTYLNEQTIKYDKPDEIIELIVINIGPGEEKNFILNVQTLKVWDNYFTLYLNERLQRVDLTVSLADKTPLFGKDTEACATQQPFVIYFGPDCGEGACDGITTDRDCIVAAKRSGSATCTPIEFEYSSNLEQKILNQCQQALKYSSQITRNAPIGWGIMVEEDRYSWEKADWYIEALSEKAKTQRGLPSGIMNGDGGWAVACDNCTNPDGSQGFFDLDNQYLVNKFSQFVYDLSARYGDKLNYYEMANEPAAEFYFCSCDLKSVDSFTYIPDNTPECTATSGANQPVCNGFGFGHNYKPEFAEVYGDFLAGTVKIANEQIKKNNPKAFIVTGAIDDQPAGLTPTTKLMIEQGILDNDNVAIGIHQYPHNNLQQLWSTLPVNCSYYQKPNDAFWLPEECEKAPPLDSFTKPSTGKNISAGQIWQEMDSRYDASQLLKDAQELGVLDKIYFFDSELHAGYANFVPKYDLSEAIGGFRIGVINAHQKFLGTIYVLMPDTDFSAEVFNLMVKTLTGVTPVYQGESKLIDSDYSGLVYKLFTRGNEDILVFWNNTDLSKNVNLKINGDLSQLSEPEIITLDADKGTAGFIAKTRPDSLPTNFLVKSVKEIKIISVVRNNNQQPFTWLKSINY